MYRIDGYHRPTSVTEAVGLLAEPGRLALAGGTSIRHDGGSRPTEVVDLQALGLDRITSEQDVVHLGAMVRLHDLVGHEAVPDLVRRTARSEMPSTLRTIATVGGTIGAAGSDSTFLAALLVHDASVQFADGGSEALSSVLKDGLVTGELIVAVAVNRSGATAIAVTGRTPADDPIVAAVARSAEDGVRLALSGVGSTPELVEPGDLDRLEPPGDFRGSSAYRRHLAQVLSARVLQELS